VILDTGLYHLNLDSALPQRIDLVYYCLSLYIFVPGNGRSLYIGF